MVLLSWGGNSLNEAEVSDEANVKLGANLPKVLWDSKTGQVLVIDFEQAVLAEHPRQALDSIGLNKRARRTEGVDLNQTASESLPKDNTDRLKMQDDILAAQAIFC